MFIPSDECKIFISYRIADKGVFALTDQLKEKFEQHFDGQTFLDRKTIKSGTEWAREIDRALEKVELLVVCIGDPHIWLRKCDEEPEEDEIDWVLKEIKTALARKIPILPLLCYDNSEIPEDLPSEISGFADWQAHRLEGWEDEHVSELVRVISGLIKGQGPFHGKLGEIVSALDRRSLPTRAEIRRLYFVSVGLAPIEHRLEGAEAEDLALVIRNLSQLTGAQICVFAVGLMARMKGNGADVIEARKKIATWLQPWVGKLRGFTVESWKEWDESLRYDSPFRIQLVTHHQRKEKGRDLYVICGTVRTLNSEAPTRLWEGTSLSAVFRRMNTWLEDEFGADQVRRLAPRLECFITDDDQVQWPIESIDLSGEFLGQRYAVCLRILDRHGSSDDPEFFVDADAWEDILREERIDSSAFTLCDEWRDFLDYAGNLGFVLRRGSCDVRIQDLIQGKSAIGLWRRSDSTNEWEADRACRNLDDRKRPLTELPEKLLDIRERCAPDSFWHEVALLFDRLDEPCLPRDAYRENPEDDFVMAAADQL